MPIQKTFRTSSVQLVVYILPAEDTETFQTSR